MSQQPNAALISKEACIQLALQAIKKDAKLKLRRAAALYNVDHRRLIDRRAGMMYKSDRTPNLRRLLDTEEEMRSRITHISKMEFLPCFKRAFDASITKSNIHAGFRGAGLIPHDLDAVISKLGVRLRTPSPASILDGTWQSQTPGNTIELGSQPTLVKNKMQRHIDSLSTSMVEAFEKLAKGAAVIAHKLMLAQEVAGAANEAYTQRKSHKRKHVQHEGVLTAEEGLRLATLQEFGVRSGRKKAKKRARTDGGESTQQRCRRCNKPGHNTRTCKQAADSLEE